MTKKAVFAYKMNNAAVRSLAHAKLYMHGEKSSSTIIIVEMISLPLFGN